MDVGCYLIVTNMELLALILERIESDGAHGLKGSIFEVHNGPAVGARSFWIDNQRNFMGLWFVLVVVDPFQNTLFGLLPVVGGIAVHIESSCVGSDDVDDWNLLDFLLGHEAH